MTSTHEAAPESPEAAAARKRKERVLLFIVVFLGLLIVASLVAMVLRVIYLSRTGPAQPASQPVPVAEATVADRLALPAGAIVKTVSASDDRLAVHYEGPDGAGIAVVDLASGVVVRRLEIVSEPAKP